MKPSRFAATRNRKYAGKNTFTIHHNLPDIEALIGQWSEDLQAAVRPAAQAGAEVLYQAVRQNVQSIGQHTGSLYASIYQKYSPEQSGPDKAVYHVSWRTSDAELDENGQPRRSGKATAPHGHLVEFGHIQRYAVRLGEDGKWYTLVRPSMRGKKKPKRRASQAEKDAYYVLRAGGPVQHPARPFLRPASARYPEAVEAATNRLLEALA